MTNNINLPPLPNSEYVLALEGVGYMPDRLLNEMGYSEEQMRAYARDAVMADRELRGEPVAWRYELAATIHNGVYSKWSHYLTEHKPDVPGGAIRGLTPLYLAPQPVDHNRVTTALERDAHRYRKLRNASVSERNRLEHYAGPELDKILDKLPEEAPQPVERRRPPTMDEIDQVLRDWR